MGVHMKFRQIRTFTSHHECFDCIFYWLTWCSGLIFLIHKRGRLATTQQKTQNRFFFRRKSQFFDPHFPLMGKTWKMLPPWLWNLRIHAKNDEGSVSSQATEISYMQKIWPIWHVSKHAIASSFVSDIPSIVIKSWELSKHANKLPQKYINICASNGVPELDVKKASFSYSK